MTPEVKAAIEWAETNVASHLKTHGMRMSAILAAEIRRREAMTCETCQWNHGVYMGICTNEKLGSWAECRALGNFCGAWRSK
jgi:hypothetical protein